jgi:glycolate oxidase FAD binding subunit
MIEQWQAQIATARSNQQTLQIRGGASKKFYGQDPTGEVLDTRQHTGIVNYEPSELVVTAKAGTALRELEATLAKEQQMLAFEPPHFGQATVGGCIAAGLSGPRRARAGALRDFVLGCELLNGQAQLLSFGGQVMKNVAGYDVSRFLAGSLGILGVLTEVSLKVLPVPEHETTLSLNLTQCDALKNMAGWAALPLPISATVWHDNTLSIRLSGAESAVISASKQLGGDAMAADSAIRFWQQLKEQRTGFFTQDEQPLWRVALPATTPALDTESIETENVLLEWNGTQRWLRTSVHAEKLRDIARQHGGHATLFRGGDKSVGVFAPLSPPLAALHTNLKNAFDPDRIFNAGRLYPQL